MKYLTLLFVLALSACSNHKQSTLNYWVKHSGDRMKIMKKGDFNPTIDLRSLQNTEHLFALGPIEGLKGEITINDSKPSISTLTSDKQQKDISSFNHKAIFLVYGTVKNWLKIEIKQDLDSLNEIEQFVKQAAVKYNLPLDEAFPFKIEGVADDITFHVIYKQDDKPHNIKQHKRSKFKFNKQDERHTIVGFWANSEAQGIYTSLHKRTHMHYISDTSTDSGHIDNIMLNSGAVLFIPMPN